MTNRSTSAALALALLGMLAPLPSAAAWPIDPLVNVPLCGATGRQIIPNLVSDGSGGAIVTWQDFRAGSYFDVYAQRVLSSGSVDPAWPANGFAVKAPAGSLDNAAIVTDGSGGAIIAWGGFPNGTWNIVAQHVLASGATDLLWPAAGRTLCASWIDQEHLAMVSDGAGGAIAVWQDYRQSSVHADIYAQHVLASGAIDPAWPADGRAICAGSQIKHEPAIATDGAGGAFVVWEDIRSAPVRIYAHHVQASGNVDPGWPNNGVAVTNSSGAQMHPAIVADNAGGAIVTWVDSRVSGSDDIYAQRLTPSTAVDPAWPPAGLAVCAALNHQSAEAIASDLAGGAIVTWADARSGTNNDVYAQRVLPGGTVDPMWPADGRPLCTASDSQEFPAIASDGSGGAIVTWQDYRSGGYGAADVYAQHVLSGGTVDSAWPANGQAVSTAAGGQYMPAILTNVTGDAIITWQDGRGGSNFDIYAQQIKASGTLGGPTVDVPASHVDGFALEPVRPNPAVGASLTVHFSLSNGTPASLELFDVAGRQLAMRDTGSLGPGSHAIDILAGRHLPPGLYLVRLRQGSNVRSARVVVID